MSGGKFHEEIAPGTTAPAPGDLVIHDLPDGKLITRLPPPNAVTLEYRGKGWTLERAISEARLIARWDRVRVWSTDPANCFHEVADYTLAGPAE